MLARSDRLMRKCDFVHRTCIDAISICKNPIRGFLQIHISQDQQSPDDRHGIELYKNRDLVKQPLFIQSNAEGRSKRYASPERAMNLNSNINAKAF